jgi:hypothetical protein
LAGFVLRLFNRAAAAVAAVSAAIWSLCGQGTLEKFEARNFFQLAMCGHWQPEESCQREKDVSEMPHAHIDAGKLQTVQLNLKQCPAFSFPVRAASRKSPASQSGCTRAWKAVFW